MDFPLCSILVLLFDRIGRLGAGSYAARCSVRVPVPPRDSEKLRRDGQLKRLRRCRRVHAHARDLSVALHGREVAGEGASVAPRVPITNHWMAQAPIVALSEFHFWSRQFVAAQAPIVALSEFHFWSR